MCVCKFFYVGKRNRERENHLQKCLYSAYIGLQHPYNLTCDSSLVHVHLIYRPHLATKVPHARVQCKCQSASEVSRLCATLIYVDIDIHNIIRRARPAKDKGLWKWEVRGFTYSPCVWIWLHRCRPGAPSHTKICRRSFLDRSPAGTHHYLQQQHVS